MSVKTIAVIGGSGFLGRYLAEALEKKHIRAKFFARRITPKNQALLTLPHIQMVVADPNEASVLRKHLHGCDAVIQMAGILHGSRKQFENVHVGLTEKAVQAAKHLGISRFIQISALGAHAHAPSCYLQTKGRAERIVQQSGLNETILRPSVIFGAGDEFLNLFAKLSRLPFIPLAGAKTQFAPIWVADVAQAIAESLDRPETFKQSYDLVGPHRYTLKDIVHYVAQLQGYRPLAFGIPESLAMLQAFCIECLPGRPLMSCDNVKSLRVDNISLETFPNELFGFKPQALEAIAPSYLGTEEHHQKLSSFRER